MSRLKKEKTSSETLFFFAQHRLEKKNANPSQLLSNDIDYFLAHISNNISAVYDKVAFFHSFHFSLTYSYTIFRQSTTNITWDMRTQEKKIETRGAKLFRSEKHLIYGQPYDAFKALPSGIWRSIVNLKGLFEHITNTQLSTLWRRIYIAKHL